MKWGKHRLKIFCAIKNQLQEQVKNKQLQIIPSEVTEPKEFSSNEEVKPVSIHKIFMGFLSRGGQSAISLFLRTSGLTQDPSHYG